MAYLCGIESHTKNNIAMKRHVQKSLCPVSKNFYASITGRVRESLGLVGRMDAVEETLACIDRYMADGTVPPIGTDAAILLTFNLLRMEIDKALQRSRRARRRAADNKAAADRQFSELAAIIAASATGNHEAPTGSTTENLEVHDMAVGPGTECVGMEDESTDRAEEEAAQFVPRNRRERRLYEQELRRAPRRLTRRLARQ